VVPPATTYAKQGPKKQRRISSISTKEYHFVLTKVKKNKKYFQNCDNGVIQFCIGARGADLTLSLAGPRVEWSGLFFLCKGVGMTRRKSALIIFVVLGALVAAALYVDYTDTYVADRFRKALAAGQYEPGESFSLDAFLDYFDWDAVCVVAPGSPAPDLRNRFGLPYLLAEPEDGEWSLVFSRDRAVMAVVTFADAELAPPRDLPDTCMERWATFMSIEEDDTGRRLTVVH
jgi:hypothetical protein